MSGPGQLLRLSLSLLCLSALPGLTSYGATTSAQHQTIAATNDSSELAEAQSLLQQGRVAEAKSLVTGYLQSHTSSVEGYNLLGIVCGSAHDYEGALEAFQHAVKLNPASTKSHNNLGNLYAAAGKNDLAEKEFRKSLSLAPTDAEANYGLALLLMSTGKPVAAIPLLQRVRPASIESRMNLVRAYLRAGRTAEGLKL